MPASEQLERILYILPMAARDNGVSFAELERALDCDRATILKDIGDATARVYHHAGGSVDAFEITFDSERVHVHAAHEFKRPVRLNAREALILGLGLRVLASETDVAQRARVLALAERLERDLATPRFDLQPASVAREAAAFEPRVGVSVGEDDLRSVFADAIEQRRLCVVEYMKPHAAPALRKLLPQRLIYGNGHWYVAGIDVALNEPRTLRLDRVISAELTEQQPETSAVAEQLSFYVADEQDELEVRVRYSPRVARWIAEHNGAQLEGDGSIVITHRVADPDWLVRHVLQYAGEAVVETPALRRVVAERAAALSA